MKPSVACGARTRAGTPCRKEAGWGTEHLGQGRCRLHGGSTPVKHGRYSGIERERIRDLTEKHEADPDPLNIEPELASARALYQDFVERYDEWREAVIAWHASFSKDYQVARQRAEERGEPPPDPSLYVNKPRMILDLSDGVRHLRTIAQIAHNEKRLRLENAISRKDLYRIFTEQRRVVEDICDTETATRILDGFRAISLA